jgi:hypothetical protein
MATVEAIMQKKKVKNRGLWFTSLAYMAYMLDDEDKSLKFARLATSHAKEDEISAQLEVVSLLNLVKHEADWDLDFQEKLMFQIQEIDNLKDYVYDYERFRSQMMLAISRKFLTDGNVVLAALFESKVKGGVIERYGWGSREESGYQAFDLLNENATSADLDDLFELWNKSNKTPLEEFLFADIERYKWRITDLWATQYFREDNLGKALEIYKTIPDSIWQVDDWRLHYHYKQELHNDPFESNIYGRSYNSNWGKTYTKPEFVKEIIRLKTELDGPEVKEKAQYALLLGNAYYNMTYHGNSYYFTEYSWSSYESDDYPRDQSYYYNSERAFTYYQIAEDNAPNDAFAA